MKRAPILLSLCLLLSAYTLKAQSLTTDDESLPEFTKQASAAFIDYYKHGGLQEKLYLVTDRPYYSAGDNIYFSAFLLHSIFMTPLDGSSFIYVELISSDGDLVTRLKVKGEKGRFDNVMPLSTRLAPGRYTLRAYSKWMTNFDDAFLFRKEIEIGNFIDDAVQPRISYAVNDDQSVDASILFVDNNGEPIRRCRVEYSTFINGKGSNFASKTDDEGFLRFRFKPSEDPWDRLRFKIEANDRKLERTVQLPSFSDNFSVKFMPEGGNLISGISQIVAFKAIGTNGKSLEVEGYVSDAAGNRLCDFSSKHDGMGVFVFTGHAGETYTATVTSAKGVTKEFALPQALTTGCALHVKQAANNTLLMKVTSTPDIPSERLAAIIQSRGMLECVIEKIGKITRVPLTGMPGGIAQISIVDKPTKSIVAERLIFIDNPKYASARIECDRRTFSPRQKMTLDVEVRDSEGNPAKGSFALTVTDAGVVDRSNETSDIYTYMLLSSDLRGDIENPSYYFHSDDPERRDNLDLVMLTHGWRRYDLGALLNGRHNEIKYPVEETQRITGSVTGVFGKIKDPSVMIFDKENNSEKSHYSGVFPLNASNRFTITGIDIPDSAYYYIQALNKRGHSRSVRVKVDPETYPSTNIEMGRPYYTGQKSSIPEEYLFRSKESFYNDGGIRVVDIDAIVVTAQRTNTYSYSTVIDEFNTMRGELGNYASIYDALQRFHQLDVIGSSVRVKAYNTRFEQMQTTPIEGEGNEEETLFEVEERIPAVFVNGSQAGLTALDMYDIKEVESLSYVNATDAAFLGGGPDLKYGAIVMEVKHINPIQSTENLTMAKVLVPGYCKPAEFYSPDYTNPTADSKKDLRSTIAWEPQLRCDDGHAKVSFWAADRRNDYDVVLEGVTDKGELCRATCRLKSADR